jgi:drug/metabolite transporter (DMT)-like permease
MSADGPPSPPPPPQIVPREDPVRGIILVLVATALFAGMDAASKILAVRHDPLQICWARYVVQVSCFALMFLPGRAEIPRMRSAKPRHQILRGVLLLASSILFVCGLARLPMAEATAIGFAAPFFITALSIPLLGEKVGWRRWMAVIVGFGGILVVVRPGFGSIDTAALFPLISAACWAGAMIVTRQMSFADPPATTLLWSSVTGLVLSTLALPFVWVTPTWQGWGWMALMGLLSASAHFVLVRGYQYAAASLLAPLSYSQIVWAPTLGYLIFGDVPDRWTWAGGAVIVTGGLYVWHRERVRAREAREAAERLRGEANAGRSAPP